MNLSHSHITEITLRGIELANQNQEKQAIEIWSQVPATQRGPRLWGNLGKAHLELQQYSEAIFCLEQSIQLDAENVQALKHLYQAKKTLLGEDAVADFWQPLVERFPENHLILYQTALHFQNINPSLSLHYFERAQMFSKDTPELLSGWFFTQHYQPHDFAEFMQKSQRAILEFYQANQAKFAHLTPAKAAENSAKRLHIGLVSGDFKRHPVGYFIESLLTASAAQQFDWTAYSNIEHADDQSAKLRPIFQRWYEVKQWSDEELIAQIRADGIDVLIDLSGYTNHTRIRIFSTQVVPVQIEWLGWFTTSGLPTMNAIIADSYCVPSEEESYYQEKVWRLPHTRLCMARPIEEIAVNATPALANEFITFGCFQNPNKLNDEVLQTWGEIAQRVPQAKWRFQLPNLDNETQFRQKLIDVGFSDGNVRIVGKTSRLDYLAAHHEVDLILDTFPYTGGTTTAEALYMGVPTLTLTGKGMLARQGEQIMSAAGLREFVCQNRAEYIAKALHWSNPYHFAMLNQLRQNLREKVLQSPLYDTETFARDWCDLVRDIWRDACGENVMPSEKVQTVLAQQNHQTTPSDLLENFALAAQLRGKQDYAGAKTVALALLAKYPLDTQIQNLTATILYECADYSRAIELWQPLNSLSANCAWRLASCYVQLNQLANAHQVLTHALEQYPHHVHLLNTLAGVNQLMRNWVQMGDNNRTLLQFQPDDIGALMRLAFFEHYIPENSGQKIASDIRHYAEKYAQLIAEKLPFQDIMPSEKHGKPLHIGLVSGDLYTHPVGYFIESLLTAPASRQFQWTAYHNSHKQDDLSARIAPIFSQWHDITDWHDEKVIEQIRADGIDILIDLSGYTAKNRLGIFTIQTAPVQISWLGWFATTGLPKMNAVIADLYCVPSENEKQFSEKIYRMPHTRLCMSVPKNLPEINELPALKNGFITFGCFQNLLKINDKVLQTWAKIAQSVPRAKWRFQTQPSSPQQNDVAAQQAFLRQRLIENGFVATQIEFHGSSSREDYFLAHQHIDFILDSFPYTGGTTTAEALLMGIPTLTLAGNSMLSRQGVQIISAAELNEFVAQNEQEYLEKALFWCQNENFHALNQLRMTMREKVLPTPLFNAHQFAEDWCALIKQIWQDTVIAPKSVIAPIRITRARAKVELNSIKKPTVQITNTTMPSEPNRVQIQGKLSAMPSEPTSTKPNVNVQNNMPSEHNFSQDYSALVAILEQHGAKIAHNVALSLLEKYPQKTSLLNLAGVIFAQNQQLDLAVKTWQKIAENEQTAQVCENIAGALIEQQQFALVQPYILRAMAQGSINLLLVQKLADYFEQTGQYQQFAHFYLKINEFLPNNASILMNIGVAFSRLGQTESANTFLRASFELEPSAGAITNLLFNQCYQVHDAEKITQQIQQLAQKFSAKIQQNTTIEPLMPFEKHPPQKLHIGLVSCDLHEHPVGYFLESLLQSTAAQRFDWTAYSYAPNHLSPSLLGLRERIKPRFQHWRDMAGISDEDARAQIRADGIDVLIDLGGYTGNQPMALFATQTAPVQISWLGWFATTGLPTMQAVIADQYCVPSEEEHLFSEKVYRLPHTRLCMMPPEFEVKVSPTPALKNGFITFGCFQNIRKINNDVLQTWAKIAQAVPNAKWRLQLVGADKGDAKARLQQKMRDLGFSDGNIEWLPSVNREQYFQAHQEIDVILDTFPYTGGTTTASALWAGVPSISLTGKGMLARQGEQMLRAVGLDNWVVQSVQAYIEQAIFWSKPEQWGALNQLRLSLRERALSSPLFDGERFGQNWCDLVEQIWRDYMPSENFDADYGKLVDTLEQQGAVVALPLARNLAQRYPQKKMLNLVAVVLMQNQQKSEAVATWQKIAPDEQDTQILTNLGLALLELERHEEAQAYLERVRASGEVSLPMMLKLIESYHQQNKQAQAIECYQDLADFLPNSPEIAFNFSQFYAEINQHEPSQQQLKRALSLRPDFADALINLWFSAHYQPHDSAQMAQEIQDYGVRFAQAVQQKNTLAPVLMPSENKKRLKIGLVSGDLYNHPVGYFLEGLLQSGAATQFDWVAYAFLPAKILPAQLELTERIKPIFQAWHDISQMDDEAVMKQIRSDGIDVLIDLGGYTKGGRLSIFAVQNAPVQISWLGWFATTGLPTMQVVIADNYCVPSVEEHLFSEKVYRLPHTRLCMMPPEFEVEVSPTPALKNGFITFGCFQNVHKINDEVLQTWAQIAQAVPDAKWRLQVKNMRLKKYAEEALKQKMHDLGFSDGNVIWAAETNRVDYFKAHQEIDVILDTFPYTGGTTTASALWASVPTISLTGDSMLKRQGEQLLRVAGLDNWVVRSPQDYIQQAIFWSKSEQWGVLNQLRFSLRDKVSRSPLFNTEQFGRDWAELIHTIWHDFTEKNNV